MNKAVEEMAARMKSRAKELGMTQLDIAETLGVSPSMLCNWMNGRNIPKHDQFVELAGLLEVGVVWLVSGSEEPTPNFNLERVLKNIGKRTKEQLDGVPKRIRQRMRSLDINEAEMAKLAGVSKITVDSWLSGKTEPNGASLSMLSNGLEVSHIWIKTGEGFMNGIGDSEERFCDRFRSRLKELGLKQVDIVKSIGVGKSTVSKWTNSTAAPSTHYLYKLSKVLETTPNWLLEGTHVKEGEVDPIVEVYGDGGSVEVFDNAVAASLNMKKMGYRIGKRMVQMDKNAIQLCIDTGCKLSEVNQWVAGELEPSDEQLEKLAEALETNVEQLTGVNYVKQLLEDLEKGRNGGERIKQELKEKGLGRSDVAAATGVNKGEVTQWLQGSSMPKTIYLMKIAKLLDCSLGYLLNGYEEDIDLSNIIDDEVAEPMIAPIPVIKNSAPVVTKQTTSVVTETAASTTTKTTVVTTTTVTTTTTEIVYH